MGYFVSRCLLSLEIAVSSISCPVPPVNHPLVHVKIILPGGFHSLANIFDSKADGRIMDEELARRLGIANCLDPSFPYLTQSLLMPSMDTCWVVCLITLHAYVRLRPQNITVPALPFPLSFLDFGVPLALWS